MNATVRMDVRSNPVTPPSLSLSPSLSLYFHLSPSPSISISLPPPLSLSPSPHLYPTTTPMAFISVKQHESTGLGQLAAEANWSDITNH